MASFDSPAISVVGVGAVAATPDLIVLTVGVETTAATPGEAMRTAASKAAVLDQVCANCEIPERDRQTAHVSVQPVFDHQRQVVSHHQATYLFRVTVRDLAAAGELVEQISADAVLTDALRVQHVALTFADPEPMLSEARAHAVVAARRHAEQLSAAAGVALGPLRFLSEGITPGHMGPFEPAGVLRQRQAAALPMQPGTQELSVQVFATFDIGDTRTG